MKFELLNAALCSWAYDDKEVDKICTRLKGTVYEKRISIVSKLDKYSERERKVFVDINSLEELKELSAIFGEKLVIDFEEAEIVIYDNYIEQKGLNDGKR